MSQRHAIGRRGVAALVCAATLLFGGVSSARAATAQLPPMRIVPGLEEPLVATGPTTLGEDRALDAAVTAYRRPVAAVGDFVEQAKPLASFLRANPETPWRTAILTDLGIGYYHAGYFTSAERAWREAWQAGRAATEPRAKALADRAFGELARMHARVGDAKELEDLFADAKDRVVSGPATEMVTGAHEGLWMFRNDWGTSYLCGPMALRNLLIALKADRRQITAMDEVRSGPHGFTFEQVDALASKVGLEHRIVRRELGQPVPVPSIVNWKMHHYAAIVGEQDGRFHLIDPTFGGDLWVSAGAIDAESSGYFLVPASVDASTVWRTAASEEMRMAYGMGNTGTSQAGSTTDKDHSLCKQKSTANPSGMCVADAKLMLVSLSLNDVPVGYRPAIGPSAKIRLTYNQREASQPAVFSFLNVSPKWTLNLLSWVQDNPSSPGNSVLRYAVGGGSVDYSIGYSYSSATGQFSPERQGQAILVRVPATGAVTSYELRMPDGSKQIFARLDGATTFPRRVFLSKIVDPQGNALALNYDAQIRLISATDATGRNTTFSYESSLSPLLVTKITDPFGRFASLAYDSSGRLASITDVLGLTSAFTYDTGGLINALTTAYGTSRFTYGSGSNNERFLEMTDPLGATERVEFIHSAPGITDSDSVAPPGFSNFYLSYRNTFYWDKYLYPITHTDYTKAQRTHWLHNPASQTSPVVESVKAPLENRVWNAYPGQSSTYFDGSADTPLTIARVLDDGTTESRLYTYNTNGKPLTAIDGVGRKTLFTYDAAGIDLTQIQQQTTTTGVLTTIASLTYNSQHLPLAATDAAGQTTRYAYNAAGQLVSTTNPLNQTTSYAYDGFGRLISVTNANGATQLTLTYDGYDRVATRTDSEGRTVAYTYDVFDRVTQIAYPDGTAKQYSYDRLDLASMTDRLGRVTTYAHDANRRLTAVTDPLGQTTRYGYYANDKLATLTDPKGNVTRWSIDIEQRSIGKQYATGVSESYAYENTTSRLKSITDALGQVKTFSYAKDDRRTAITYARALVATPNVTFAYDAFYPRLLTMADGVGTTRFDYRPIGVAGALQLASEDGPYASNDTITYQYDAVGRVATRTVDSTPETFGYDAIGRIASRSNALGAFTRSYLGQTGQLTSQSTATVGTAWTYDTNTQDRRLLAIGNSGQARSFGFVTTPEDRITGIAETIGSAPQKNWGYTYDATDRLIQAQSSTGQNFNYGYDASDNLTSVNGLSASYNGVNQITTFGGAAFVYDANGNLTDDGLRTFQWDAENRLVGIAYKAQPGQSTTIKYDGIGRRLAIVDTNAFGSTETRYLWCADRLCQARNAADVVTRRYFSEGVVIPQSGQLLYYGTDQIGSIRDLLTAQTGSRVGGFDYDPYGNATATTGRVSSDFRYAGMFLHGPSNLYLTNYRPYDPRTGRWLTRDPILEEGGIANLYDYAGGNPISYTDPLGLSAYGSIGGEIGTIAGGIAGEIIEPIGGGIPGARLGGIIGKTIGEIINIITLANKIEEEVCKEEEKSAEPTSTSPDISADELRGKTKEEIDQLAKDKGLVPDPKKQDKWRDPVTGKERLRADPGHIDRDTGKPYDNPRAAGPHAHGYNPLGRPIGDPQAGGDPHFPTKP